MKKQLTTLVVFCLTLLIGCGSSPSKQEVQPTATIAPPTVTFTPTLTSTPEPTITPTTTPTPRLPVIAGTLLPASGVSLSNVNIGQVVELAHWGKGVITGAVYSPDGKNIAVASTLGITILNGGTLDEVLYFETNASISSIAYSPDGKMLATGLNDNTVKTWQVSDGSLITSFESPKEKLISKDAVKDRMTNLDFSPDGSLLAGGSSDNSVLLWSVTDGTLLGTFEYHTRDVTGVFFSPDSQTLFSAAKDGKVRMINVVEKKLINSLAGEFITEMEISKDGKTLVAIDYSGIDSKFILWNVDDGKVFKTIQIPEMFGSDDITSIAISPDGRFLVAGWNDYTVKIWNLESGTVQRSFSDLQPKSGWYYLTDFMVGFSPNGQTFFMAGSNVIGVWDFINNTFLESSVVKSQGVYDIALSPDGLILASVEGPNVNLLKISDGMTIVTDQSIQSNGSVDFDPEGSTLAAAMFDRSVQLWPLSDKGLRRTFEPVQGGVDKIWGVDFSPDGRLLALGLDSYPLATIELRQVSDGALVRTFTPNLQFAYPVVGIFSPDGQLLAGAFGDQLRLYQVVDGKPIRSYSSVYRPIFSPDGTSFAAVGTSDNSIKAWKLPSGDSLLTIKDRPNRLFSLVYSPDSTLMIAGSADGTIEVFLASDGSLITSWMGHSKGISDMIFTQDGKYLVTASYDGTIRVWGIKP